MNNESSRRHLGGTIRGLLSKPRPAAVLMIIMITTIFVVEFAEVFPFPFLEPFPKLVTIASHLFLLAVFSHYLTVYLKSERIKHVLSESEEKFRAIFNSSHDGMLLADTETRKFLLGNERICRMLGYTLEELQELGIEDIHPREDLPYIAEQFQKLVNGDISLVEEVRVKRKDDGIIYVDIGASNVFIQGRRYSLGMFRDVAEHKAAEEKLRRNEASLAEAQRIAHLGNWEWDISRGELRWSDEIYRIFGLTPQEFEATYEAFLNSVHPDDRESVKEAVNKALAEHASYSLDHRIVRPDGTVRTVHEQAEVFCDEQGEPRRMTGTVQDITERKTIEEKLHQSQVHQKAILSNIPDIAWLKDRESRFVMVNETFANSAGFTQAQLVGKTDLDLWPRNLAERYRADDREVMASRNRRVIEEPLVDKDGKEIWIETIKTPIMDEAGGVIGTTGIARDITARRQIESALREGAEFNREVLNSLDFSVAVLAPDGQIIAVNREWERFARENDGAPERTGLGVNYLEVCRAEAPEAFNGLQDIMNGALEHFELEYPCHSPQEKRWFILRVVPLGKERGGLIVAHVNITARKRLEEELEKQNQELESKVLERTEELEEKTIQAEAANRAKSQFLANMSHELKTPLNAIIGFSELLKAGVAGELTAQQNEYIQEVWESGRHLNRIIGSILNMTEIVSNQVALELSEFPLKEAIEEILGRFSGKAAREGIKITIDIPADIVLIVADRPKILQVLQDLLGNACKFMPDGGDVRVAVQRVNNPAAGSLSSERQEIYAALSSRHSGNFLEISVADTGIGIAKGDLGRLFHPFQQLEPTMTKKYEGVGLGLSICRKYVELHGGKIWVESEVGKGSTFYLAIPELEQP